MPPLDNAGADDWITAPQAAASVGTTAAPSASADGHDDWITATAPQSPPAAAAPSDNSPPPAMDDAVPSSMAPPSDDYGLGGSMTAPSQDAVKSVAERVGQAVVNGWRDAPDILTPEAQQWLANAEKNNPRPNAQDVLTVGHAVLAAGNAVFRGGLEGIATLGDAVGMPQLGRDVAGYYEAMGMTGAPHAPGMLRSTMPETRAALTERDLAAAKQTAPEAVAAIGTAPDIDSAIAAAGKAVEAPVDEFGAIARGLGIGDDVAAAGEAVAAPELTQTQREQAALAAMKARANGTVPVDGQASITPTAVSLPEGATPGDAPGTIRLYRGEGGSYMGSQGGGGWFTTDPTKAARYAADGGTTVSMDVPYDREHMTHFAGTAGAPDEYFATPGDMQALAGKGVKPQAAQAATAPGPTTDMGIRRAGAVSGWLDQISQRLGKPVGDEQHEVDLRGWRGQLAASVGKDGGATPEQAASVDRALQARDNGDIAASQSALLQPQSVGAAARDLTQEAPELTPAQKATALQKMVNQAAEDRLTPQGRDDAVYVPGVERPEAMRDFTSAAEGAPSSALEHKTLYNTDSNYHDQFDALVKKNNNVMVDKLNDLFGDANARDAAMNEAKELMPGPIGLFDDESVVDAQPIVDRIHEILAGPAGKRGAVESTLKNILPKLYDADGNLEVLPSMLKGVRDDITDRLYDKSPTTEGNAARTARNQLNDVLSVVDRAIADGLPGTKYEDYLSNLSAALGTVSKLDYLQKFLTGPRKLTDLAGNLQYGKVQRMLEDIQAHHADKTGGAKELSPEEINQIEAVRNELAAKDLLDRRASVRGSPTAQLTNAAGILGSGPLGTGVRGAAEVLAHGGLAMTTGGVGNAMLGTYRLIAKPMMEAAKARAAAEKLAATKQRLLDTAPRDPDMTSRQIPPAVEQAIREAPAIRSPEPDAEPTQAMGRVQPEQAAMVALEKLRKAVASGAVDASDPMISRILRAAYGDDLKGEMSRAKLTGLLGNFARELQARTNLGSQTPSQAAVRE